MKERKKENESLFKCGSETKTSSVFNRCSVPLIHHSAELKALTLLLRSSAVIIHSFLAKEDNSHQRCRAIAAKVRQKLDLILKLNLGQANFNGSERLALSLILLNLTISLWESYRSPNTSGCLLCDAS